MSHDQPISARGNWREFVLILLVFFIHGGAPTPQVNETYYLTKAKHYWDPAWCAGDFFLESADAHLVFYWTIGWLAKFFSLPTVAWIGRFAAWALLAWSWQRLCRCVTCAPLASVLGAALLVWLTGAHNFAGEWVVGGIEGKCIAYACVFAGLSELAKGHWQCTWPWLGVASAFHVLVGGWAALAAGFVWLFEPRGERTSLTRMAPFVALALVLALPGLVPALQLTRGVSAAVAREANEIYVFQRLPHHLAPLSMDGEVIYAKTTQFALPLLTFVLLWQLTRVSPFHERSSQGRGDDNAAANPSPSPSLQGRRTGDALNRICRFAAWSFLISFTGLLWEIVCTNSPPLAASLLKYYWFRLADVAVPVAASILVCYWLERFAQKSRTFMTAFTVAVALACWHLTTTTFNRWHDPTPPADKNLAAPAAWREACEWIRDNTPVEALFLVPRSSQTLSWYAGRKSLVTWKDVPQDAAGLVAWSDRYEDVFWHYDEFGEYVPYASLGDQGTDRIRVLAAKYNIDYVVADEYPPLPLPVVFANGGYIVYAVSPTAPEPVESAP